MTRFDAAAAQAQSAAERAAVEIAPVAVPGELEELRSAMASIWGPEVVPPRNLLRGLALSGACLLVARRDGRPVGFALGWLGWDGAVHLHSHQVGVREAGRGGGVGYALKLAQRALCLQHGIAEMRWTFDPLLRANARFNLCRLGAEVVAFLPHCYGDRTDAFNTGDTTDRVEVRWQLEREVGGREVEPVDGDTVLPVPSDYLHLRTTDPAGAAAARAGMGDALRELFDAGGSVRGLGAVGYVVRRRG